MQMAASAFDILIGSVSDNIGLRWVWTNQRCNRTACIHRMQFKGLGFPNKYFATQNKQMYIRLHCLRVLWSLSTCPPILKIILQARPSVFKFNLKRTVVFVQNEMHAAKASCTQKRRRYLRFLCLNRRCDLLKIQRDFWYDKSDPVVSRN